MTAVTGQVAAAERGETRIADRVVAKIAAQAAKEAVDETPEGGASPRATVTVHRDAARVRVSLELRYPCDIGRQCGAVRSRVAQRVKSMAGMDVPEVAVQVERLHTAGAGGGQGRIR
ncbi:Asp23/Gls24 family envelope stress response protein [Streptomyces sp. SAI-25]|uniref:Asp23/Gls24 family envelope stress response protein n=1 Tax=Streptomyces sp. SAI-25 TaxID=1472664 RepID=UPI00403A3616